MPTNRTKRLRKRNTRELATDIVMAYLTDQPFPEGENEFAWIAFTGDSIDLNDGMSIGDHWKIHRVSIIEKWAMKKPGTRPSCWWRFDAPRWDDPFLTWYSHGTLHEPRMVTGSGRPTYEKYAALLPVSMVFGLMPWCDENTDNPPMVESQAAYLKRHHLLLPGETITEADLAPENLTHVSAVIYHRADTEAGNSYPSMQEIESFINQKGEAKK